MLHSMPTLGSIVVNRIHYSPRTHATPLADNQRERSATPCGRHVALSGVVPFISRRRLDPSGRGRVPYGGAS